MGTWNSIAQEIASLGKPDALDIIRRQKMDAVCQLTRRHLVVYAADFTSPNPAKAQFVGQQLSVILTDKDSFDEVTRNLSTDRGLDILLHSPGGSAEATESIVEILRARFSDIRFIIPSVAKSAATMMAMSGNELLMDECSELGPTDPQMMFIRDGQFKSSPVQAIKDQFDKAQREINADASKLPVWVPILNMYGPSLLAECDNHLALSQQLVAKWLRQYMFAGAPNGEEKAKEIAKYLAGHNNFLSHARRIGIDELKSRGVHVFDLRTAPELRTAIRDLYISVMLTFNSTGVFKIVENQQEEALISSIQVNVNTQQEQQLTPAVAAPQQALNGNGSAKNSHDRQRARHQ